jgi:hypothetical protein
MRGNIMSGSTHARRRFIVAAAAVAFVGGATPPAALAEPNSGNWDLDEYNYCLRQTSKNLDGLDPLDIPAQVLENQKYCCYRSGGEWSGDKCVAPSGNSVGTRQIPPGIETAPVVTQAPSAPIKPQISGDMPTVTLAPACPPGSTDPNCQTS